MKKIKLIKLVFIASLVLTSSCKDYVIDKGYQDDPNTFGDAPAANILGQAELQLHVFHSSDPTRYAGILSNQISGIAAQWSNFNNYDLTTQDFNPVWDNMYVSGAAHARLAGTKAAEQGNKDLQGTAQLLEAIFVGELASFFGNIPYSEALGKNKNPKFDSQIEVLNATIKLLDDAIGNASSNSYLNDKIGGTSTTSSIQEIANSLKARYYMILKDYPNALASAKKGIKSRAGDLILTFNSATGAENMFWQFGVARRAGNIGADNSYLFKMLTESTRKLATPGDTERANFYYKDGDFNYSDDGIFGKIASLPAVTYYETKLIEAEAAARTGGDGLTPFNEVRKELKVQYGGEFPKSTATGDDLLVHILEEKYITLFPSPVVFHDLQRTNNKISVTPKKGTNFPKRFIYSQSELNSNSSAPKTLPKLFDATPVNK